MPCPAGDQVLAPLALDDLRGLGRRYPVLAGTNSAEAMEEFEEVYTPQNLVGMTAREGGWPALGGIIAIMGAIDAVFAPRLLKKLWDEQDREQR